MVESPTIYEPLNLNVLLVEDDEANAQYASKVLRRMGCVVTTVRSAEEAFSVYDKDAYHLILLDIHLPEMDGVEFLQRLRDSEQQAHLPEMPVQVLTADALVSNREDCLASGANGFMCKPIRPEQIYHALKRYTKGRL